MTCDIELF